MTIFARLLSFRRSLSAVFALFMVLAAPATQAANERLYGGTATDAKHSKLYWALPESSSGEAQKAAVAECKRAGGKGCLALSWFADSCVAWARNSRSDLFPGNSVSPEIAAKQAVRRCTAESPDGMCKLSMMPVCVGPGYSPEHNKAAANATPQQLEALSAKYDTRGYWGAVAEDDDGDLSYADQYPNEEEAVKMLTGWDECKNCKKVLTYTDTCVGMAWPKGVKARGKSFTVKNTDPEVARDQARETCNAKTGQCVAFVRCSGRAYIDGYKGLDEKAR